MCNSKSLCNVLKFLSQPAPVLIVIPSLADVRVLTKVMEQTLTAVQLHSTEPIHRVLTVPAIQSVLPPTCAAPQDNVAASRV